MAGLCAREGLVLLHHFYNHHNLVEASAHWADFPWRPANALQDTGFPEPPPYEEDGKRVRLATAFYDLSHSTRRELHRLFIRHGLSVFADEPNVIHVLAFQDAAPLEFQQFFLDTVAEWQKETGHRARIALMTGKNVTDAILADPARATLVDVIDTRYWQYMADGTLFAPPAGGNRAYREYRTEAFGKDAVPPSTPEQVDRQIREYSERFPSKVVWCPQANDLGFKYWCPGRRRTSDLKDVEAPASARRDEAPRTLVVRKRAATQTGRDASASGCHRISVTGREIASREGLPSARRHATARRSGPWASTRTRDRSTPPTPPAGPWPRSRSPRAR